MNKTSRFFKKVGKGLSKAAKTTGTVVLGVAKGFYMPERKKLEILTGQRDKLKKYD